MKQSPLHSADWFPLIKSFPITVIVCLCLILLYLYSCRVTEKQFIAPLPHNLQEIPLNVSLTRLLIIRKGAFTDTSRACEDIQGPERINISYQFNIPHDFLPKWLWNYTRIEEAEVSYGEATWKQSRGYLKQWILALGVPDQTWMVDYKSPYEDKNYIFMQWIRQGLKFESRLDLDTQETYGILLVKIYYTKHLRDMSVLYRDHMTPASFEVAEKIMDEMSIQQAGDKVSEQ